MRLAAEVGMDWDEAGVGWRKRESRAEEERRRRAGEEEDRRRMVSVTRGRGMGW